MNAEQASEYLRSMRGFLEGKKIESVEQKGEFIRLNMEGGGFYEWNLSLRTSPPDQYKEAFPDADIPVSPC